MFKFARKATSSRGKQRGQILASRPDAYPRLRTHRRKSCSNFEIMPMGIHRPDLDQDLGIAGMLKGRRA
jgi:hypothetical protein